tara:strand:+ start:600 stop:815 length:216 start_codon:yes stop_codon:yes gene_type:complete
MIHLKIELFKLVHQNPVVVKAKIIRFMLKYRHYTIVKNMIKEIVIKYIFGNTRKLVKLKQNTVVNYVLIDS